VLTVVLILEGVVFYRISGGDAVPLKVPLSGFPTQVGEWKMVQEGIVEKEIQDVLRADDILQRVYADAGTGTSAGLFIAYFETQRTGRSPHSPRNCLAGAGWEPSFSDIFAIPVPGQSEPIQVNRYLIAKGDERSVVLYWYQTPRRVIASEYQAKVFLVTDAIRYNRTNTALVRVVVPVGGGAVSAATDVGVQFIRACFPLLQGLIPS
jgi:EpsI family protein